MIFIIFNDFALLKYDPETIGVIYKINFFGTK